ncbi:hypothetical protein [Enterococcus faecium]|uniref:hypothetical protein n=1 Tax=Enterococcus faecium TaxID=1352 RepID=UPI0008133690|nr:hypothetical protein [Enterococcus faecium]
MSKNHLERTASLIDADILIFKSLLVFEKERVEEIAKYGNYATVPSIYSDLTEWFKVQTGLEYSQKNLEAKLAEYENHR